MDPFHVRDMLKERPKIHSCTEGQCCYKFCSVCFEFFCARQCSNNDHWKNAQCHGFLINYGGFDEGYLKDILVSQCYALRDEDGRFSYDLTHIMNYIDDVHEEIEFYINFKKIQDAINFVKQKR